jgi:hypothetical protein
MEADMERNPDLGQVWTPASCALSMVHALLNYISGPAPYKILDPAVGPATFQRAFYNFSQDRTKHIVFSGYDIDKRMCSSTRLFCKEKGLRATIRNEDFILSDCNEQYDAVIMNPPYIRQECIPSELKRTYYKKLENELGFKIDRRSNLFVLFLLKSLFVLRPGGIMCVIVYDAIMHSKYGAEAMQQIERRADILGNIEAKAPFGDAIIDARIITWQKRESERLVPETQTANCSPSNAVPLGTLLKTIRGTALPYRKIFIANPGDKYYSSASPIFIKQRNPNVMTCEEYELAYLNASAELQNWLLARIENGRLHNRQTYIKPITGGLCFNYYLRNRPRHLLNTKGLAISDNYYVSTPLNRFPEKAAWILLNSDMYVNQILSCARNQGRGLLKLQAYEYRLAPVPNWNLLSSSKVGKLVSAAETLLNNIPSYDDFRSIATNLAKEVFDV